MPGGDGTGPRGFGPMTGRAAGYCAGYSVPGYANPGVVGRGGGLGWGRGGGGRGWRNWYGATGLPGWTRATVGLPAWGGGVPYVAPPVGPNQELAALQAQAKFFENALADIEKRINEIDAQGGKTDSA